MSKIVRFLLWTLGITLVVAFILRYTLLESWTVPANDAWMDASVAPTLRSGDVVLLLTVGSPGFGDLARCRDPEEASRWVVGRIVGLEGDVVELQGSTAVVNGKRYTATDACLEGHFKVDHPDTGSEVVVSCSRVEMAGGWHFEGSTGKAPAAEEKKWTVGPGRVFLLSDDRDVHDDSRDFGAVPLASCSGHVVFRLWSSRGWSDSKARMTVIR